MGQLRSLDFGRLDIVVGRIALPTFFVERLDDWQLEHQCALDFVDFLHGGHDCCKLIYHYYLGYSNCLD